MSVLLISEAFELYKREAILFKNQSAKTAEMNDLACKSLLSSTEDIPISELTFEMIVAWKEKLLYGRSQNTARGYLIKLRNVLRHLALRGYAVLNYELISLPKRTATPIDFLTEDEVSQLLNCVFTPQAGYNTLNRYRNRAMIALLYSSGIRVSELCSLDRLSIRSDRTFTIFGKGNKPRLCFVDERAYKAITEYLDKRTDRNKALFISHQNGKRITKCVVQMMFRYATDRMGYPKPIHPHMLRHSFATNLLENNTNLYYVSKFLGHSSVQTTEMYLHYKDPDLKKLYTEKHTI